ncbi:hypothetical protein VHEMI03743 [[Torrubiella] hemipterigena]|uniref:Uncharacterized protein n=1 Tax=[Torrubiella] hemipterigena TaxID=1531966 RepID=A0A0A1TBS5_9HYPO|nr:hypothetical protein VHEMI03743 [[Torrubiella] hemipterigena]
MPVAERGRPPPPGVAASRAINRNPLTPKVAAKGSPVGSPMNRKPQGPLPMLAGANRDDNNTPNNNNSPAPYLASNITPRSGSRQIRAETFHGTPTPAPTAANDRTSDGWDSSSGSRLGLGLTVAPSDAASRPTSMLADSSTDSADSKFFYASDAKNVQQQSQPSQQRPTSSQKPATFFYANGTVEPTRRTSPPSNTQIGNMPPLTADSSASKFFYANGQPDGPVKQPTPISSSASTLSTTSRPAPTSRPTSAYSVTTGPGLFPRPTSPIKQLGSPGQGFRTAMSPVSPNRVQATSPPGVAASDLGVGKGKRRISIETAPPLLRHQTEPQLTERPPLPKLTLSPNPSEQISPPLSPDPSQASLTMASILRAAEALEEKESEPSGVQSPTKSTFSDAAIQDLVVNARRERKVQDLEITNASLEAINRTLERQLRKQTSELRRFRRLSRSGRLSLNSIPNSRNVSAALTDPAINLSDLSEHEETDEEEDDDSMDDSFNSPPDSPSGLVESPAALRRKRDERRLQLDLTKHQEILVDSQKMNQSIKRCLNWTDLLIKEGQKALAYKVNVSDIKFGGRILTPLDEEEDASHANETTPPPTSEQSLEPSWMKGAQDRDSGIELQAGEGSQ